MNLFYVSVEAIRRAASKRIELHSVLEDSYTPADAPRGHYLYLDEYHAQIIAVDDHRPTAGTYDDLLEGYDLTQVSVLPDPDQNAPGRIFVSIVYRRS